MAQDKHYDVIIIGTGAGGGTLVHALASTGKSILVLERGDYVRREKANWDSRAVNVEGKYQTKEEWRDKKWQAAPSAHQLLRRRQYQILRCCTFPTPQRRFRGDSPFRRNLASLAHLV